MSKKETGGPAFPAESTIAVPASGDSELIPSQVFHPGMTLRDWFAGKSLIAILSTSEMVLAVAHSAEHRSEDKADVVAKMAYEQADAMLKAREQS